MANNGTAQSVAPKAKSGTKGNTVPTLGVEDLKTRAGTFVRQVRQSAPKNGGMLVHAVNGSDAVFTAKKQEWLDAASKFFDDARSNAAALRAVPASVNTQFIVGIDTNAGAIIREFAGDGGELKKAIVKAFPTR